MKKIEFNFIFQAIALFVVSSPALSLPLTYTDVSSFVSINYKLPLTINGGNSMLGGYRFSISPENVVVNDILASRSNIVKIKTGYDYSAFLANDERYGFPVTASAATTYADASSPGVGILTTSSNILFSIPRECPSVCSPGPLSIYISAVDSVEAVLPSRVKDVYSFDAKTISALNMAGANVAGSSAVLQVASSIELISRYTPTEASIKARDAALSLYRMADSTGSLLSISANLASRDLWAGKTEAAVIAAAAITTDQVINTFGADVQKLQKLAVDVGMAATKLLAIANPADPFAKADALLSSMAVSMSAISVVAKRIADDPPNPNFGDVVSPSFYLMDEGLGRTKEERALIVANNSLLRVLGYMSAALDNFEKYQGAWIAKDFSAALAHFQAYRENIHDLYKAVSVAQVDLKEASGILRGTETYSSIPERQSMESFFAYIENEGSAYLPMFYDGMELEAEYLNGLGLVNVDLNEYVAPSRSVVGSLDGFAEVLLVFEEQIARDYRYRAVSEPRVFILFATAFFIMLASRVNRS